MFVVPAGPCPPHRACHLVRRSRPCRREIPAGWAGMPFAERRLAKACRCAHQGQQAGDARGAPAGNIAWWSAAFLEKTPAWVLLQICYTNARICYTANIRCNMPWRILCIRPRSSGPRHIPIPNLQPSEGERSTAWHDRITLGCTVSHKGITMGSPSNDRTLHILTSNTPR